MKDTHVHYPKDYNSTNGDDNCHCNDTEDNGNGGVDDHECKDFLDRPVLCYNTTNAMDLRRREKNFCHTLPKFELLKDQEKKVDLQAVR